MKKLIAIVLFIFAVSWMEPASAQTLHPKGKFNFLRGRQAFVGKNYNKTIKEMNAYLKFDKNNHQVYNYLAQSYHKLKNTKMAKKYYTKAIDLAPSGTFGALYSFNLGVLHYDGKNYKEALPLLKRASMKMASALPEVAERKALAYYYVAFIHYNSGRWNQAKLNFAQSTKYSKKLRQGAWFYHAICDYKLGRHQQSIDRFKLAERLGTSRALTNYAKQFLDRLNKVKPTKAFGLNSSLGLTFDTNLTLEPQTNTQDTAISDEAGEVIGFSITPSYVTQVSDLFKLRAQYNFGTGFQVENHKHRNFDYFSHSVSLALVKDFKGAHGNRLSMNTGASTSYGHAHQKNSKKSITQSIAYLKGWNAIFSTDFQVRGEVADFPEPVDGGSNAPFKNNDRDQWNISLSEINFFNVPNTRFRLKIGAGLSYAETQGDAFDAEGHMVVIGVNAPLGNNYNGDLTYKWSGNRFFDRRSKTITIAASVFKPWTSHISSSFGYTYTAGRGSRNPLDYDRHLWAFTLFHSI